MLHIAKLAVGVTSLEHLGALQAERAVRERTLRHRTRRAPRRRDEVLDGGSLYWVVAGTMMVRQRIVDVVEDAFADGSAAAAFVLDPVLVRTDARPVRPFQGWRYLLEEAAPADLRPDAPEAELPPALQAALRALCLL